MKSKPIVTIALLGFVGISLAVLAYKELRVVKPASSQQSPPATDSSESSMGKSIIAVYYFHGDYRCSTCLEIEKLSREAIHDNFADQLQSEAIQWRLVNFDRPENAHFLKDFDLASQSLVLVEELDGSVKRWRNLSDVWTMIYEGPAAFQRFVVESVSNFEAGATQQ